MARAGDSLDPDAVFRRVLLGSTIQWFSMMLSITAEYELWLRVYGDDFAGQARLLSTLASTGSVIGCVVNPLLAALVDGIGRRAALLLSQTTACAKAAAVCLLPGARTMVASNLLMPLTIGSWELGSRCVVADLYGGDEGKLNAALGQLSTVPVVCAVLCPLAGSALASRSLRLPFAAQTALWVLNTALAKALPETAPPAKGKQRGGGSRKGWLSAFTQLQPLSVLELFRRGARLRMLALSHMLNEMTEARNLYQVTDLFRAQLLGTCARAGVRG
jgi:MFS family permease